MVVRTVYVKLIDSLCTPAGRDEVAGQARDLLGSVPGVRGVEVGVPADGPSEAAWDVCFHVRFDDMQDLAAYNVDDRHVAWVQDWLAPRAAFKKAWNWTLTG